MYLSFSFSLCNVLQDGTTDKLFHSLYEPIISRIVDVYEPGAIVLQCGADSLAADRLGNFSMTIAGALLMACPC
jgi:histone deacetylase 1/2